MILTRFHEVFARLSQSLARVPSSHDHYDYGELRLFYVRIEGLIIATKEKAQ